jgi:hypothetical protein
LNGLIMQVTDKSSKLRIGKWTKRAVKIIIKDGMDQLNSESIFDGFKTLAGNKENREQQGEMMPVNLSTLLERALEGGNWSEAAELSNAMANLSKSAEYGNMPAAGNRDLEEQLMEALLSGDWDGAASCGALLDTYSAHANHTNVLKVKTSLENNLKNSPISSDSELYQSFREL